MARIVNLKRFPSNIADRISRAQAARGGRNTSVSSTPQTDAQKREAEIEAAFENAKGESSRYHLFYILTH